MTDVLITYTPNAEWILKYSDFIELTTFNAQRLYMLPDVPTLREISYDCWRIIFFLKETPEAIVDYIVNEL